MRNRTFFASLFWLFSGSIFQLFGQPANPPVLFNPPLSQRIANYDIIADLDTETDQLTGKQILTWTNPGRTTVQELRFHLYMNAFRNSESTFMIEKGRRLPDTENESGWGYIDINKIAMLPSPKSATDRQLLHRLAERPLNALPGLDVTATMQFIQPDIPEHTEDKTVLSVTLPRPVLPGETISLFFDFLVKLPDPPADRTGALDEFYFVAQWFPKIGVWTENGWNCHQFHYHSEFFADFGEYNVWMTVPSGYLLGATGVQVGTPAENENGTITYFYHAEDVHDFAWTASPEFVEFKGTAQDVEIRALIQKDHVSQGARHIEAAKSAVETFQNWYGDYPYPNITVVDPRRGASAVDGMEYPTLFTVGTHYGMPEGIRLPELVIIHEFGHNYWQGMVASNEFEESWLDEGINTYTELQIMNHLYGPRSNFVDYLDVQISDEHFSRLQFLLVPDNDPIVKNSWQYASGGSYTINSYQKPGLYLQSLHNMLGEDVMRNILRTYFERWKFRHPKSQDFVDIANEISGKNLQPFFDQALYTTRIMDYSIERIFTRRHRSNMGFDYDFPTATTPVDTANMAALADSGDADTTVAELFESGFTVRRLGDFIFPVTIEVVFSDGETIRENWDGEADWQKFSYIKSAEIVSATVDPDHHLVMDVNFTNNSRAIEPHNSGANKLSARWLFWMQFLLDQPELLNLMTIFAQ